MGKKSTRRLAAPSRRAPAPRARPRPKPPATTTACPAPPSTAAAAGGGSKRRKTGRNVPFFGAWSRRLASRRGAAPGAQARRSFMCKLGVHSTLPSRARRCRACHLLPIHSLRPAIFRLTEFADAPRRRVPAYARRRGVLTLTPPPLSRGWLSVAGSPCGALLP